MMTTTIQKSVLCSLINHPSRASAAAIGHQYVLDGAPPGLCVRAVEALGDMPCDWGIVILAEAVEDSHRPYPLRVRALNELNTLLQTAIARGYSYISPAEARDMVASVAEYLRTRPEEQEDADEVPALDELASHLCEAVADGYFGELPDF